MTCIHVLAIHVLPEHRDGRRFWQQARVTQNVRIVCSICHWGVNDDRRMQKNEERGMLV